MMSNTSIALSFALKNLCQLQSITKEQAETEHLPFGEVARKEIVALFYPSPTT